MRAGSLVARVAPSLRTGPGAKPTSSASGRFGSLAASPSSLLILGGITVVGLALRLPSFGDALIGDEVSTYGVVAGHGPGTILDLVRTNQENTPPLYYLATWAIQWLGQPPESVRTASMIAGVAAIPLTYLLGIWTVGARAALLGAGLVALSPFLIFYSTEARAYSLGTTLALLSTLCLLRALEVSRLRWWVAYAGFSVAAMYAHYIAGFVLLAQLAWALIFYRGAWRALLGANIAALLAYLPWLPGLQEDRRSPTYLLDAIHPFGFRTFRDDVVDWAIGSPLVPEGTLYGEVGVWLMAAGVVVGVVGLALRLWNSGRGQAMRSLPRGPVLVVALAAAAPVGAALYSALGSTVFIPRNLIVSSPALALAVAALLTTPSSRWLRVPAVVLVLGGIGIGSAKALDADYRRPDYAGVAGLIQELGPPGSPVVEAAQPTPGPQTQLEAALGSAHEERPGGHPVFSLGLPPVAARHRDLHLGIWPYLSQPLSRRAVSTEAARLGAGGRIYFVAEEVVFTGAHEAIRGKPPKQFREFISPRFEHERTVRFPGSPWSVLLYIFTSREAVASP